MKRCPQCGRDYYDATMLYCLDDGSALLEGPATAADTATAILPGFVPPGEDRTRAYLAAEANPTAVLPPAAKTSGPGTNSRKVLLAGILGVLLLAAAGVGGFMYYGRGSERQIDSVAVMPFVNESGSSDVEYLSDGMTETLIKGLSNIPNLNVKARSSVFRYKGEADIKRIAKELGVQAVVTGHITQRADDITLSLELVDAVTENVLWTDRYTRKQGDLVRLQSEIAGDIANSLKAKLSTADRGKVTKAYTANAEAYRLYLMGRFMSNKGTADGIEQSVAYYEQAVALDPQFALAYAGIADARALQGTVFNAPMEVGRAIREAKHAAESALKLDPNLSEAYTSRAWIRFRYDWDWAAAEQDFQRSLQIDPENSHAHHWYGEFLSCMGRREEGIAELRRALEIEPFSAIINWNLAKNLFDMHRDDESIAAFQKARELGGIRGNRFLSILYEGKGMAKEAFDTLIEQEEVAALPAERRAELKVTFERSGIAAARRQAASMYVGNSTTATPRAVAYVILGDERKAIDSLKQAYAERNGALVGLITDRLWDAIRDEPEFRELVELMKFPRSNLK